MVLLSLHRSRRVPVHTMDHCLAFHSTKKKSIWSNSSNRWFSMVGRSRRRPVAEHQGIRLSEFWHCCGLCRCVGPYRLAYKFDADERILDDYTLHAWRSRDVTVWHSSALVSATIEYCKTVAAVTDADFGLGSRVQPKERWCCVAVFLRNWFGNIDLYIKVYFHVLTYCLLKTRPTKYFEKANILL